jgi:hypothetical protein
MPKNNSSLKFKKKTEEKRQLIIKKIDYSDVGF